MTQTSIPQVLAERARRCSTSSPATGSTTARSPRTPASSPTSGLESLDLVVLGTMLQQRYGRLPFAEFLAEIGQRPVEERDLTVAELVAFVCEHRATDRCEEA